MKFGGFGDVRVDKYLIGRLVHKKKYAMVSQHVRGAGTMDTMYKWAESAALATASPRSSPG